MILTLFLSTLLYTSIAPLFFHKKDNVLIASNQIIMILLIIASISYAFYQHQYFSYTLNFMNFNGIKLTLAIQFDALAKIMMIFILLIGFLIYRYAQNYLESDNTRIRFLSQFNLVLASVLLLVMSANLLTAFIAWQFIGINLYLLLNHYHHDPAANQAAKKKFVINRIGDCTFLLAIIIAYHSQTASSFAILKLNPHASLIGGLLFISVMTKSAQFPFHIWLIDTMETPTPVSALMHAGVINAGGILLTRISDILMHFHVLVYLVLLVGLISACLSIHWMNQQPDTKKKLAYSTMGQMGYMLTQCSLGGFPAAVFHLISHGFYKASLFLNAGETLKAPRSHKNLFNGRNVCKSLLVATLIFGVGVFFLKDKTIHIPILMYGFIFITITTLIFKINNLTRATGVVSFIYYLFIGLLFAIYIYCFNQFSRLLPQYEYSSTIAIPIQLIIIIVLFTLQYFLWVKNKQTKQINIKDRTERFLRHFLLNPLRWVGNIINITRYKKIVSLFYYCALLLTIVSFCYGLFYSSYFMQTNTKVFQTAIFVFLTLGIIALVLANRCLSIRSLIIYLVLFELAFTNIAFFDGNNNITKIGIFHIINISTVLIMLILLAKQNTANKAITADYNRLPTRVFYLVFSLLLLIGIPGTASFISEFYLLSALINNHIIFVIMYISLIILVAIVVMHSLQLYAFSENYSTLLSQPITRRDHIIFLVVIALNIVSGIFPNLLLQHL